MALKGIDVSAHNGNVDWKRVNADGIDFAIIRLGIGSDNKSQDDKKFTRNVAECDKLNIPYGIYIYSYALNDSDVMSEVAHTIRLANQCKPTLGIWFDMEDADGYKAKHNLIPSKNKQTISHFCELWLEQMRKAGFTNIGIYASYDYFKNILNTDKLRTLGKIWLAHWGISKPSITCDLWQYTSDGIVSGISGRVDMNYYYTDITSLKPHTDTFNNNTSTITTYTVKAGDTLSKLAMKFSISVKELARINKIANVNLIKVGQVLIIKTKQVIVTANSLNVRSKASALSSKVGIYHKDQLVDILEVADNGWGRTDIGWINLKFTKE